MQNQKAGGKNLLYKNMGGGAKTTIAPNVAVNRGMNGIFTR